MTLLLTTLYTLAIVDASVSGYSAAAGRNALIRKRVYFGNAMARGFLLGQFAAAVSLSVVLLTLHLSPHAADLRADLARVVLRMLQVYLPYAALILGAFGFRALPSVDVRCLTSTLVFGPLAALRPWIGLAGLAWGVAAAPRIEFLAGGTLILALWLSLERILTALVPRQPA